MIRVRSHPLVTMLLLAAIAVGVTWFIGPDATEKYVDPAVLLITVGALWGSCVVMLAWTGWAYWTMLGAGILGLMAGTGLYFFLVLLDVVTDGPDHNIWLYIARALAAVGGVFIPIGLYRARRGLGPAKVVI